jgi:hypothetical protein
MCLDRLSSNLTRDMDAVSLDVLTVYCCVNFYALRLADSPIQVDQPDVRTKHSYSRFVLGAGMQCRVAPYIKCTLNNCCWCVLRLS